MFDFSDKRVIVTGGSRGLGKAIAKGFAEQGAKVVIASRKLENCEALAAEISAQGGEASAFACNTGNTEDIDALLVHAVAQYGGIDIVVNNAGINIAMGALSDLSPQQFDKMYQVNLRGPWYLASRAAAIMAKSGGGAVINFLSVSGLKPPAYMGFYAATKAGLEALTKVMAAEWAGQGIRVNAIAPGSYHSDLTDASIAVIDGFEQGMKDACLLGRIADTEEIVNPVFYLAGEQYTTGITLVADGGYMVK